LEALAMQAEHLHILQHSLGLDQYGRGSFYRNHFVTGEGSDDHPGCMALVAEGLMTRHAGSALTGEMDLFRVTEAGRAAVVEHSLAPPKLTAGQRRYRQWLNLDGAMSFGQWLLAGGARHGR
jgi:hypothetical protein